MEYRIEKDTMGEVKVPAHVYWGAQTQRSIDNFKIAQDINKMPKEIIKAFAYLKKAVATNEKYNRERALNANLNPLGGVYFALTQYDSALYYFKQAFSLSQKLKSERQLAIASSNIGAIYYMKNDFNTAIDYYKTSLDIYKKNNNLANMPVALSNLGEAYIAQNNFTEGFKLYDEALLYCEKAKEYNFRSEIFKMYADAYVKKGDYKQAYDYQVKFKSAKDSLTKKLYNKNVAEAETKYETKEKEAKIAQQKLELFRQQSWLITLIISLLALAAFAYLYYNRNRLKQKAILDAAIIREQQLGLNAVIEAQEAERKRIAKDLHDGIAQELVALKLGFNRLQNKIERIAPDEAVNIEQLTHQLNESCTEVRNIAHVMMPPSLETSGLVSALEMLLRNSLQHTDIKTEFEHFDLPERLNDKTEIGLYRIAQELLNNILKHAQASKIILQLYKTGNQLIMRLEDNGQGFDFEAAKNKSSMGLLNILSRVNNLGGTFFSEKGITVGTVSTIRIPL